MAEPISPTQTPHGKKAMAPPPMHAKSDSEVTSLAPSSPPHSPRRPLYYVNSPSHHDPTEKLSLASSPPSSPFHHHHHSRESSDTRFSAPWKKLSSSATHPEDQDDDDPQMETPDSPLDPRCYAALFVLGFFLLFSLFSLVLWGCSKAYRPRVSVRSIVFENFNLQGGMDDTGVPTKMLSLNSTVRISFHNPATFFGIHVTFTPLDLYYFQLKVASGNVRGFYQPRKSHRALTAAVGGEMVPLYGGGTGITSSRVDVPLTLTFVVQSRAYVLGRLVKSKFYARVRCSAQFREGQVGRPVQLRSSCEYRR